MPVRASVPVSSSVSHPPSLPPIYSVAAVRKLEAAAQASDPDVSLMERAGAAAARAAVDMLADSGRRVTVLAGPGNNGGDAIEVAVHLRRQFYDVAVAFLGDPQRLPRDAARALSKWQQAGGSLSAEMPARRTDLIVDGLFGIGLTRPPEGAAARWIDAANRQGSAILALDIPSGLQGDTGAVLGCAIRATRTVTFIGLKPGLLTLDGPDHSGELAVDALGFDWTSLGEPTGWLLDDGALALRPPPRPRNFHKGNAGTVAVIGGAAGMVGAAFIAGRAALQVGAGKVLLGMMSLESAPTVDLVQPELMVGASAAALAAAGVVAIGPGLGREAPAKQAMLEACSAGKPLVVDADALNLAATDTAVAGALTACAAPKILTPHPAEAARLLGVDTGRVQADRVAAAAEIARRFAAHVVLKGNGSIVAHPSGPCAINASGNPGMASAGMGDALTGLTAGLLAQGLEPERAARFAVWLHGAAGDRCAADGAGPFGITASDVIASARRILNQALRTPADRWSSRP